MVSPSIFTRNVAVGGTPNNLKTDLESGSVLYLTMPDAATIFTVVRDPSTDIDIVAVTFASGTQYEMKFKLLEE